MELTRIGQIVGALGLKGQVKVKPLTTFEERFDVGSRLFLNGEWTEITSVRWQDGRPVVTLSGITSRSEAEELQWAYLEAPHQEIELEEGVYRVEDLVGMTVASDEGQNLGVVSEVLAYPAQDVLVVGKLWVPMVKDFVLSIDLTKRHIIVKIVPGMSDLG